MGTAHGAWTCRQARHRHRDTRGTGRRIVELLLAKGCSIGFCARNEQEVNEALSKLTPASGAEVRGGAVDVTDDPGIRSWIAQTAQALGELDILMANASVKHRKCMRPQQRAVCASES